MTVADDVRELKAEIRKLRARVAALEAAQAVRPKRGTAPRRGYVDIPQAASDARWNLWVTYYHLKVLEVCGAVYNRQRGELLPTSKGMVRRERARRGGQALQPARTVAVVVQAQYLPGRKPPGSSYPASH
jgi:hypothetical protein